MAILSCLLRRTTPRQWRPPYRRYFPPPPVDGDSVYYSQYKKSLTIRKRIDLVARATYSRTVRDAASRAVKEQHIDLVYLLNTVNVLSPSIIDAARSSDVPVALRLSDFNLLCPAYAFLRDGQVCQSAWAVTIMLCSTVACKAHWR